MTSINGSQTWSWRKDSKAVWQGDYSSEEGAFDAAADWWERKASETEELRNNEEILCDVELARFENDEPVKIIPSTVSYVHYHGDFQEHIHGGMFV